MPSLKALRTRINSVKSTRKITQAMKMVAASKLKRAQSQAEQARPYAERMERMLGALAASVAGSPIAPPMLVGTGKDEVHLLVVVSADRGLCGAYNQNVLRLATGFIEEHRAHRVEVFTIGRKGRDLLARLGVKVYDHADAPRSVPTYHDAQIYARKLMRAFFPGDPQPFDAVYVAYTRFKNVLTQEALIEPYLPIHLPPPGEGREFVYEPGQVAILERFLPQALTAELFHFMLESSASEHAARMVAMENASRNAETLVQELTLAYNKARQQLITNELLDIAGGAEALQAIR